MSGIFKSNSGLDTIFTSGVKGFKKVVTCDKHIVRFTSEITCDEYLMEVAGYLFRRYNHNKSLRYLKFKNWSGMGHYSLQRYRVKRLQDNIYTYLLSKFYSGAITCDASSQKQLAHHRVSALEMRIP